MRNRRSISFVLVAPIFALVLVLVLARAAAAAPIATSLGWVRLPGAEGCADARALAEAVERRLGRPAIAAPARAERAIEGRIEPAKVGWRATFTLTGGAGAVLGTREISSGALDCRALDEDLALVVALMIDPDSALVAAPPSADLIPRPVTPAPAPAPARERDPAPDAAPPPSPPERVRFALRGGPTFSLGLLPSAGAGFAMRVTLLPPRPFPFEIGGAVWGPQRAESPGGAFGADIWLAYGGVSACPLAGEALGFFLASCAGVAVGGAHVGGFGFDTAGARDVALVNVGLDAHARRALAGPVFVALGFGLAVPLVRLDVYYLAAGERREAFTAPPIAGTMDLALGVELR